MAKTMRTLTRERRRLMRTQNPQQFDYKLIRKKQKARTSFWKLMKKHYAPTESKPEKKKGTEKKENAKKPKKVKEPELEVIEEDIDELYSFDEDIEEE